MKTLVERQGKGFIVHMARQEVQRVEIETTRTHSKDGRKELKRPVIEKSIVERRVVVPYTRIVKRRSTLRRMGLKVPAR